jgi:hypothetical protein
MTYREFDACYRRHVQALEYREDLVGLVLGAVGFYGFRATKKWLPPSTFGLGSRKIRSQRKSMSVDSQITMMRSWVAIHARKGKGASHADGNRHERNSGDAGEVEVSPAISPG